MVVLLLCLSETSSSTCALSYHQGHCSAIAYVLFPLAYPYPIVSSHLKKYISFTLFSINCSFTSVLLLYQFPWKEWSIFTLQFPCPLSLKIIPARLSSSQLTANVVLGVTSSPGFPGGSAAKNLPAKQELRDPWVRKIPWRST